MKRIRVLVTGATGFIGRHLVESLATRGCLVDVIARPDSNASHFDKLPNVAVHHKNWDIDSLTDLVKQSPPTVVYHVATMFLATHTPDQVQDLVQSNVTFPTLLLEALAHVEPCTFVNIGTAWQNWHSGDKYQAVCLYAATKQSFQDIVDYYCSTKKIGAVTLKLCDVYGPADTRGKILNHLIKSVFDGTGLNLSPGEQKLDFVHVKDVVRAMVSVLDNGVPAGTHQVFGLSSKQPRSLRSIGALVETLSGRTLNAHWGARPYREREVMEPWIGEALPGWSAEISLEQGVKELLDDYITYMRRGINVE